MNTDQLTIDELKKLRRKNKRPLSFPNIRFETTLQKRFPLGEKPDLYRLLRDIARSNFYIDYDPHYVWYTVSHEDFDATLDFVEEQRRKRGYEDYTEHHGGGGWTVCVRKEPKKREKPISKPKGENL